MREHSTGLSNYQLSSTPPLFFSSSFSPFSFDGEGPSNSKSAKSGLSAGFWNPQELTDSLLASKTGDPDLSGELWADLTADSASGTTGPGEASAAMRRFSSSSALYFARFSGSKRSSVFPPFFFFSFFAFFAAFSLALTAFLKSLVGSEYPRKFSPKAP